MCNSNRDAHINQPYGVYIDLIQTGWATLKVVTHALTVYRPVPNSCKTSMIRCSALISRNVARTRTGISIIRKFWNRQKLSDSQVTNDTHFQSFSIFILILYR